MTIRHYREVLEEAVANSLMRDTEAVTYGPVGIYKHFDRDGLAASWTAKAGKLYFTPRGRAYRSSLGPIHERVPEEVTLERAAELLAEHGVPPSRLSTTHTTVTVYKDVQ